MPTFYIDDLDIEPSDYLQECSHTDIKELIDELVDRGYLPQGVRTTKKHDPNKKEYHPSEALYEEALNKLHGKYSNLTQEEEEMILKIANRL